MRLLVIEDEVDLAEPLAKGLRREGYAVDVALDGAEGSMVLDDNDYDLLILDLNLPGMQGLDILQRARSIYPQLLILVLTARADPVERMRGLDLGADDYLIKPFHFGELVARVRALLRRDMRTRIPILECGELRLDPVERTVWQGDRRVELARKEFAVLAYLMSRPNEVVSQEELLEHVWDAQVNPLSNVVPVHINALRRALNDDAQNPRYIKTIIGHGYQLLREVSRSQTCLVE